LSVSNRLEVIPLGGLGEFGMNIMVYRIGRECIVVDAGMMFPGPEHPGVDVIVPDLTFLEDCGTIHGVVLTHGHEDHVGALPYLLERHDVPVYATPHCRGLVRLRLEERAPSLERALHLLPGADESLALGPFELRTLGVAHSIPQSKMLVLDTSVGTLLHTADFKFDPDPPDGEGTDPAPLRELGDRGVLAMLSDSTNADRPGATPGEREVARGLEQVIANAEGKVLVTTFASNVQRIGILANIARRTGRRLALVGSSIETQIDVASRLGLIAIPPGVRIAPDNVMDQPPSEVLVAATGSQGEPLSAMARMASDRHRHVRIEEGDVVIHSARRIPGNEKTIDRMFDELVRRGATVVTAREAMVHASGHPSQDDLRRLIELVRPRYLVPIHGEYRQLKAHHDLAVSTGMSAGQVPVIESGDVLRIDGETIEVVDQVPVGRVFMDASAARVDPDLLRDRRRSAADGVVVAVVALDREGRPAPGYPQIVTRGFVPDASVPNGFHREARRVVVSALAAATDRQRFDPSALEERIHTDLKRFLRRRIQRSPLIIPVVTEL
jgi:ribonuclease J